jgi:hypothetical protein
MSYSGFLTTTDYELSELQARLTNLCDVKHTLEHIIKTYPDQTKVSQFVVDNLQDQINHAALSEFPLALALESDDSDLVLVGKNVGKALAVIIKTIWKVIVRILELLKKFWDEKLSLFKQRERDAATYQSHLAVMLSEYENNEPEITTRPIMTPIYNIVEEKFIDVSVNAIAAKAVMVAYDPELLNQVIYTGLVNILDSIRRNTFKPEDVTSLKKGLIYNLVEKYDLTFRDNDNDSAFISMDMPNVYLEFELLDLRFMSAPRMKVKAKKIGLPNKATGIKPSDAQVMVGTAKTIFESAVKDNSTVDLNRSMSAIADQIKKLDSDQPMVEDALRAITTYVNFAVDFSKSVAELKYDVGVAILSYVRASEAQWVKRI